MHITEVIKKPLLSEKTYAGQQDGAYTFIVDRRANKTQIKKTFEEIFQVKVDKVRTINYDGKEKRMGKYVGLTNKYKKAIIKLKPGEKLDILSDL
ncbi:50S ribosomal protein L23 [Spiroplasma helicoides]|uniref:Large ribosomal subunit protein uL23 n=1 Tax=Spiroplasma helicoides TaxID=216938 RepID=A0A1B3SLK9_9MOLU|nr:50S ribosomal protein L23 [Spiroplasma helicoides]AOG60821.1 50S ribosomal protein L23 [Spiroplasma helicoides]